MDIHFSYSPQLYFKYGKDISQTILNYNEVSREATFNSYEEIVQLNCQCDDPDVSRFVDAYHIVTGNLEIVQSV